MGFAWGMRAAFEVPSVLNDGCFHIRAGAGRGGPFWYTASEVRLVKVLPAPVLSSDALIAYPHLAGVHNFEQC